MDRTKHKGRREGGQFIAIPTRVMDSPNYVRLSSHAIRLLNEFVRLYNGSNNGDLCATWSMMKERGFKSSDTLNKALKELKYYGMVMLTRQGGRHKPSLYAITWHAIDECKGKLDVRPTNAPPGHWKDEKPKFDPKKN